MGSIQQVCQAARRVHTLPCLVYRLLVSLVPWRGRGGAAVDLFDDLDSCIVIAIIAAIVLVLVICVVVVLSGGLLGACLTSVPPEPPHAPSSLSQDGACSSRCG